MRSLTDLAKEVRETPTTDDIVKAIIYKADEKTIPKSHAFLQQTFYQLKRLEPDLLSEFIFDESGVTPFSDELDSILFRLEASTILSTPNPTFRKYTTGNGTDRLEAAYRKFATMNEEIDHCASVFSEIIKDQKD